MAVNDLTTLINAIPTAQEGHVITPSYHNTMRAAVSAIATQLGGTDSGSTTLITSIPPMLIPTGDSNATPFVTRVGFSSRPSAPNADGWLQVQLPDKAQIINLTVIGRKFGGGGALSLRVLMRRRSLTDLSEITMININLRDVNGDPFQHVGTVTVPGGGIGVEELRRVDNSKYLYFIQATMSNAPTDVQLDLHAFLLAYNFG